MKVTYSRRLIDYGSAVEYLGGWDVQIDDGRKMSLLDVRKEIVDLKFVLACPTDISPKHTRRERLGVLLEIERRLMHMSDDNVKPEFTFADDGNGYRIDIKGTVWHQDHSAWISMVRGDGKRLYIQDMTPSDGVIVHGLVQRWEAWKKTGNVAVISPDGTKRLEQAFKEGLLEALVKGPGASDTPTGANGPAEPMPDFIAQQVAGLVSELNAIEPWNELGPFRIRDNGTVECIDVGVIVSAVAKPPYPPDRSYHVTFRSDSGRHCHDQLVLRWEARQKKSDLERVREAVQLPEQCNWRIGKTGRLCVYDSRNEFELLECSEAEAASHQLLARAMRRDAQMHEALVKAVAVLNEPSKGNGTPE